MKRLASLLSAFVLTLAILPAAHAQFYITEVDAAGSGASYGADWFELKYTGSVATNISGWKMDDSSATFTNAVALRGITTILPGQTIILLEGNATGTTDATINANFKSFWFGSSVPSGLTLAFYGGSGVGLSTTAGDGVTLFDSIGNVMASVSFGATPSGGATLDNGVGLSGAISLASVAGVNGAFNSFVAGEIGSPGVAAVPEPSTFALCGLGLVAMVFRKRMSSNRKRDA